MSKFARSPYFKCWLVLSLFIVAAHLPPREASGGQAYNIATEVMMEDITSQLLLISVISGGPVSTGNTGQFTIQPDGSMYAISFTAGGISVTDTAILSPDGLAPGTGTWTMTSNITTAGSALVTYDPGTSTYTTDPEYTFPKEHIRGIADYVNDFEVIGSYKVANGIDADFGYYTYNGAKRGGNYVLTSYVPILLGQSFQIITGAGSGNITANATNGTFVGTANATPEPSSIILIGIGISVVALQGFSKWWYQRGQDNTLTFGA